MSLADWINDFSRNFYEYQAKLSDQGGEDYKQVYATPCEFGRDLILVPAGANNFGDDLYDNCGW